MKVLWGVLCLCCLVLQVTSDCPTLANTNGIMTANITWTYDMWFSGCTAEVAGSSTFISFSTGQSKSLPEVGNDCVKFLCDATTKTLRLDSQASACAYGAGCSSAEQTGGGCSEQYKCYTAIYDVIPQFGDSGYYRYRHGWFAFFSGYTCGTYGSGQCSSGECFNPYPDPQSQEAKCVAKGQSWTSPDNKQYTCKERTTCAADTYVDLTLSQAGCDDNGNFVAEGTVTWSDACYHTVCVVDGSGVGSLVTSFKDEEGCVYQDQCVGVGETVTGGEWGYVCANLTCSKNTTHADPYFFQVAETGCFYEGQCYDKWKKVDVDGQCEQLTCKVRSSDGTYFWDRKYSGCYTPAGGCSHKNDDLYWPVDCARGKCSAADYGQWKMWYKSQGSCVPSDAACTCSDGIPGCMHENTCHPVKTVVTMDGCTQYVCHSDDQGPNSGTYTEGTPLPQWKARATGCYGPTGCMALGEQYVDPHTLNTYRCDFQLAGWGAKTATFHQACVAPNGVKLKVGDSVKVGSVWYSCYQWGKIKNPVDTSIEYVPEDHNQTCGNNPDTGKVLWKAEFYFTPVGRCVKRGYFCDETCQYYDQPCMDTDLTPWRHIGDKFTLDGAECVCTQDNSVNNRAASGRFYKPSLCSQEGVTNAACKDPSDQSLHQWGEMWVRAGSSPLEVCTCHPLTRQAFCSTYLPDVNAVFDDMKA